MTMIDAWAVQHRPFWTFVVCTHVVLGSGCTALGEQKIAVRFLFPKGRALGHAIRNHASWALLLPWGADDLNNETVARRKDLPIFEAGYAEHA